MKEQLYNKKAHDAKSFQLQAEQIKQLYRNAPLGLIASPINAAVLAIVLRNVVPSQALIPWLACIFLVTIFRLLLLQRYRQVLSTSVEAGKWGTWFTLGAGLSGVTWGSAGIFLFPATSIAHQTFIAFVLGGMAAGAAATYAVVTPAFLAYAVPALFPIIVRFFAVGGEIHTAMAVMLLLFAILIIIVGRQVNSVTLLSLRMRLKNIGLIADLISSVTTAEKLNRELSEHRTHLSELVDERTVELMKEIDERKRAEAEMRRTAERFQSLIENGLDMITVLDPDGKILYESPSIERLLGYNDTELTGMNIFEFLHPEDQDAAVEALAKVTGKSGKTENVEVRIKHKNGTWRLLDAAGKSYVDDTGEVKVIVNSRDVTDRRNMEDSLRRVQKLESLGVFAGGLAHDLNNVLVGVMANIDIALMSPELEEQTRRRLEQAMKSSDRARDLTNRLATFSKGGEPVKKILSIGHLIKNSSDVALSGASVSCEVAVPENLCPVEADEGQIAQVINNILINAVQAMPRGGVVRIKCENMPAGSDDASDIQEKRHVKITIEDQGPGIPVEHLDRIFDPYFTTK
ncbi:MAG TPA: hypothetical protein DCO77_09930, partial [Nitrospiraceae bacterium]|nr:hypothetical protein [Nitrospiraceae bacterium]